MQVPRLDIPSQQGQPGSNGGEYMEEPAETGNDNAGRGIVCAPAVLQSQLHRIQVFDVHAADTHKTWDMLSMQPM